MFPPTLATTPADVMMASFDATGRRGTRCGCAATLRAAGLRVLVYPDADKIGKQIKYADSSGIPFVAHPRRATRSRPARSRSRISTAQTQDNLRPIRGRRARFSRD